MPPPPGGPIQPSQMYGGPLKHQPSIQVDQVIEDNHPRDLVGIDTTKLSED